MDAQADLHLCCSHKTGFLNTWLNCKCTDQTAIRISMSLVFAWQVWAGIHFHNLAHIKWATFWQNQQNGMCAQQRLRSAWESVLRKLGSLATHWVHSEDSDQTGRMPRLIWVFAGRTYRLLVLSQGGSNVQYCLRSLIVFRDWSSAPWPGLELL